jgi:hypothetical protein
MVLSLKIFRGLTVRGVSFIVWIKKVQITKIESSNVQVMEV